MTYERDVIIEREGTGIGTILGIILAVIVVLALVWFFFLGGMGPANNTTPNNGDTNITIEQPQPPPVNY
jgi:Mg/Co/Ni transporter MgtE